MLYFIKTGDWYKIGYASNIQNRLKTYGTDNPLVELIGIKEGDTADELRYQYAYRKYETWGEWAKIPKEMVDVLKEDFFPYDINFRPNSPQEMNKFVKMNEESSSLDKRPSKPKIGLYKGGELVKVFDKVADAAHSAKYRNRTEFKRLLEEGYTTMGGVYRYIYA